MTSFAASSRGRLALAVRGLCSVVLVAVGLARVVGFYTGFFPLSALGEQFGASPLPLVFSQVHGVETYSRRVSIRLVFVDGRQELIADGKDFRRRLHGPFSRAKLYVDPIAFADLSSGRRRGETIANTFCKSGPLARELGLQGEVAVVHVELWAAGSAGAPEHVFEKRCSQ